MFLSRYESTLRTMALYSYKLFSGNTDTANICGAKLKIDISVRYDRYNIDHFHTKIYQCLPHKYFVGRVLMQHLDIGHFHIYVVVGKNKGCIGPFNCFQQKYVIRALQ